MSKNKKQLYFVIVHPDNRLDKEGMLKLLDSLAEKYPHLQGKIEPATSALVKKDTYIITRSL